eukprot:scaffold63058_cov69-Attheya_sp.AAC.2
MQEKFRSLKPEHKYFTFADLFSGGALAKHVGVFTYFRTVETNDLFLEALNHAEDSCDPNDGLCQNLARYSTTSLVDRKHYQAERDGGAEVESSSGKEGGGSDEAPAIVKGVSQDEENEDESSSSESDEPEYSADSSFDDNGETWHGGMRTGAGRKRKVDWKTEWLIYNCYVRCGFRLEEMEVFFGVSDSLVSDIVYAWANLLNDAFKYIFPTPTRSQMLGAYPESVIRKFGEAKIFMLMDATEIQAEIASMKLFNSALFSTYKHNSTIKWLTGTDPIGTSWDDAIPKGHPGGASDMVMTIVSEILEQVPPGMAVEVDKGFLIDNLCAMVGVICIRPEKRLNGQVQQSATSTALTQKVGKTRIPIEQSNGQMKQSTRFFNSPISILQF